MNLTLFRLEAVAGIMYCGIMEGRYFSFFPLKPGINQVYPWQNIIKFLNLYTLIIFMTTWCGSKGNIPENDLSINEMDSYGGGI